MQQGADATVAAVMFDYGGVVTTPTRHSIQAWLVRDRIDPESFTRTLRAWLGRNAPAGTPVHRLELGELTVDEFNALLADELATVDGSVVQVNGLLDRVFAELRPDPPMLDLVRELHDLGIRTAMLSNSWGNFYPRPLIDELFEPIVISGEIGLRKPDAAIFEHALSLLGLPADNVVFVDDGEPNIAGAQRLGIRAILHADPGATRVELARLVPGLAASA